jgi:hypothetical protein
MAQLLDTPKLRNRNHAYARAVVVRDALASLGNGGTASQVQDAVIASTGAPVGIDAVKAALWHLESLGVASFSIKGPSRWWSLAKRSRKS